ncbi:hypothetical protein HI914_00413 [Erysiphe necator]|nr:hypothetical protein HI914_00413 [Erysiphe necator]
MSPRKSRYQTRDIDDMRVSRESRGRCRETKLHCNDHERSLDRQILRRQDSESFARPYRRQVRSTSPYRTLSSDREWLYETSPIHREKSLSRIVEQENKNGGAMQLSLGKNAVTIEQPRELDTQLVHANWRENYGHVSEALKLQVREPQRDLQTQASSTLSPIWAPPIHQELITHHRHIDYGFESVRPKRHETLIKKTDIDYYPSYLNSRPYETQGDSTRIQISGSNFNDKIIFESSHNKAYVGFSPINSRGNQSICIQTGNPRQHGNIHNQEFEHDDEYNVQRNNERAHFGEAWNGVTKDWSIIDVPPGTKRVRLEGVGGEIQEITWQKYSGVRRSKITSDQERTENNENAVVRREISDKEHNGTTNDSMNHKNSSLELQLAYDPKLKGNTGICKGGNYCREDNYNWYNRSYRPPCQKLEDLWTEITKDLVVREAIVKMGYEFEETRYFFYIFQYLHYEEIMQLIKLSDEIRHDRHRRLLEIE